MAHPLFLGGDKRHRPPVRRLWLEAVSAVTPMPRRAAQAAQRSAPSGDGHPVLLLPGFLHNERYMQPLRRFLSGRGYAVYGWGLGTNVGPTDRILHGLDERLDQILARHGRKVSLIGHSLGGAMARELAKRRGADIRQLITLASPIRPPIVSSLEPVYRALSRWHSDSTAGLYAQLGQPPEVPVTALYTRRDGIIAWQGCLEAEGPRRENIEIGGVHSTMPRNVAAWRVIADRLAQPEGSWQPYRPLDLREAPGQNKAS